MQVLTVPGNDLLHLSRRMGLHSHSTRDHEMPGRDELRLGGRLSNTLTPSRSCHVAAGMYPSCKLRTPSSAEHIRQNTFDSYILLTPLQVHSCSGRAPTPHLHPQGSSAYPHLCSNSAHLSISPPTAVPALRHFNFHSPPCGLPWRSSATSFCWCVACAYVLDSFPGCMAMSHRHEH